MCCIVKCCNCHILLAVDMAGVACRGLVYQMLCAFFTGFQRPPTQLYQKSNFKG